MDSEIFTAPTLPNYFKLGTLLKVNELEKEIHWTKITTFFKRRVSIIL